MASGRPSCVCHLHFVPRMLSSAHGKNNRDLLQALASTETTEDEEEGIPLPTRQEWQSAAENISFSNSTELGSANTIESDVFFMGYNPGLWDFSALEALSFPRDTFNSIDQSTPYNLTNDHGFQQQYDNLESSFTRPPEEQQYLAQ